MLTCSICLYHIISASSNWCIISGLAAAAVTSSKDWNLEKSMLSIFFSWTVPWMLTLAPMYNGKEHFLRFYHLFTVLFHYNSLHSRENHVRCPFLKSLHIFKWCYTWQILSMKRWKKKNPTSKIQKHIDHSLPESRKLIWVLRVWFHKVVSGRCQKQKKWDLRVAW